MYNFNHTHTSARSIRVNNHGSSRIDLTDGRSQNAGLIRKINRRPTHSKSEPVDKSQFPERHKEVLQQRMVEFEDVINSHDIVECDKLANLLFDYDLYHNCLRLYDRIIEIARPKDYTCLKTAWYSKERVYTRMGDGIGKKICSEHLENLEKESLSTNDSRTVEFANTEGHPLPEYSVKHRLRYQRLNIYCTQCQEPAVLKNPPPKYASEGNVRYAVRKDFGELSNIAFISRQILDEIIHRAEPEGWTPPELSNFLSFRFLRAVEQGIVIYLHSKTVMKQYGVTEHSLWFNSGLVDRLKRKEIWLCLVQSPTGYIEQLYMLSSPTVFLSNDQAVRQFMSLVCKFQQKVAPPEDHTEVVGELTDDYKLRSPTYLECRQGQTIFDPKTPFKYMENVFKVNLPFLCITTKKLEELINFSKCMKYHTLPRFFYEIRKIGSIEVYCGRYQLLTLLHTPHHAIGALAYHVESNCYKAHCIMSCDLAYVCARQIVVPPQQWLDHKNNAPLHTVDLY